MSLCTICSHPQQGQIDQAIAFGESNTSIAQHFNLSEAAVRRHKASHLPGLVRQAAEREMAAVDLNAQMLRLNAELWQALERAKAEQNDNRLIKIAGALLKQIELYLRAAEQLAARQQQVEQGMEVRRLLTAVLEALKPHPEVRQRLAERLRYIDEHLAD